MARCWLRITFFLALALTARVAPAHAENEAEGRRQYHRGETLIATEKYREAIEAFQAGYQATPRVGFLLNIANCYRKLGDLPNSQTYYWRFIDSAPKDHPARRDVLAYLRTIQQIASDGVDVDDRAAAGPSPAADSRTTERQRAPLPTIVAPEPVAATAGLDLRATAGQPAPAAATRPIYTRWWFWTGVGVLAATAGASSWWLANGRTQDAGCQATLGCLRE